MSGGGTQNRWFVLALLFALHALMAMGPMSLPPLLTFIGSDFGLDNAELGLLSSSYYFGVVLTATVAGWAADYFGSRRILAGACVVSGGGLLLASQMPTAVAMGALLVVAGIGYSAVTPATNKALMLWFDDRSRATAMGIKQTGINAGGFLAALLLPSLALLTDWTNALAGSGLLVGIGGLALLLLYKPQQHEGGGGTEDARRLKQQLAGIARNPSMMALGVEGFFRVGAQFCLLTYLMLFLHRDVGLPLLAAASYLAVVQVTGAAGRIVWGLVSDRLFGGYRKAVYILIAALGSLALFGLAQLTAGAPGWLIGLLAALSGLTAAGFQGVGMSLVAEVAGRDSAGIASGFTNTLAFLGAVVLTPVCGLIIDLTGSYVVGWYACVAFSALAMGAVAVVDEASKPCAVPVGATGRENERIG
ncbi:MAG: MFS transporter [Hyphomicrobiaceae bacterium]|nr:MFS transporter [Hyphomicrobiaceae bacterium]